MWSCESCGANVTGNRIICPHCGNGAPDADAGQVALALQRDLIMEAHLRALSVWYRIGAVLGGLASLWLMLAGSWALSSSGALSAWGAGAGVLTSAVLYGGSLLLAFSAGSYLLGHFLARYVNGARITAGVLAIAGLGLVVVRTLFTIVALNRAEAMLSRYGEYAYRSGPSLVGVFFYFIVASVWSGAVVWALWSRRSAELCKPAYRTIVARTPELAPPTFKSPFFVIPLLATSFVLLAALLIVRF